MRVLAAIAAAALFAAVLAACGSDPTPETPDACRQGPEAFLAALETVPAAVELEGGTTISDCVVPGQQAGDLTEVGQSLVLAATRLNVEGRADPTGKAPVELGYLVGAVQKGAEKTSGIHADLLRRLASAAGFSRTELPAAFTARYAAGLAAGRKSG